MINIITISPRSHETHVYSLATNVLWAAIFLAIISCMLSQLSPHYKYRPACIQLNVGALVSFSRPSGAHPLLEADCFFYSPTTLGWKCHDLK